MRICAMFLLMLLVAVPAFAGPPIPGVYRSEDMGGLVQLGRFSESWVNPGTYGQIGNTFNAASWNGHDLGTQWWIRCAHIATAPTLVIDTRNASGTGDVSYRTVYSGGTLWLAKTGPWGDNTVDYTGTLDQFVIVDTYQYVLGTVLGIRSNITTVGHLNDFPGCFEYSISNGTIVGPLSPNETMPDSYPPLTNEACQMGDLTRGDWGTMTQIALQLSGCVTGVAPASWSEAKLLYR